MHKLFKIFDQYIDEKITAKTNELESLQIQYSERLAKLERIFAGDVDMINAQQCAIVYDMDWRLTALECNPLLQAMDSGRLATLERILDGSIAERVTK